MATSLGRLLLEKRESRYLSLPEAEMATHIKADYLRALEEERFGDLPGPVYVEIYLREYGRYLDLDTAQLLKMYARQMRWPRLRKQLRERWEQFWRRRFILPIVLTALVLLLAAGLGTLWVLSTQPPPPTPLPTPLPSATPLPKNLVVVFPPDQATIAADRVMLVGQVPVGALVMVNEQSIPVQDDGHFTLEIALAPGENRLHFKAWDPAGWQQELDRVIVRPVPTPRPTPRPAAQEPPAEHQVILNQVDVAGYPQLVAYFSVFDAAGEPWRNLTVENLAVAEDDQAIADWILRTVPVTEPLAVALVADVSGSMQGEPLIQEIAALRTFLTGLAPQDRVALIAFSSEVTLLRDFTTDKAVVSETVGGLVAQGNTALNDAVLYAVNRAAGQPVGRRAVIVMTDGKDTSSVGTLEEAIARAGLLNIPVYTVGLQSSDFVAAPLEQLAQETGALALIAPQPETLRELYAQLGRQFKGQYEVLYTSPGGDRTEHRLVLTTRINGVVRQSSKSYQVP